MKEFNNLVKALEKFKDEKQAKASPRQGKLAFESI